MVVVIIEAVTKKKVPFKYYSWVNVIGFGLLMLLLIIVTINDIKA
jgi:membrane-associated protease RseP (regulator of RpoE activity)